MHQTLSYSVLCGSSRNCQLDPVKPWRPGLVYPDQTLAAQRQELSFSQHSLRILGYSIPESYLWTSSVDSQGRGPRKYPSSATRTLLTLVIIESTRLIKITLSLEFYWLFYVVNVTNAVAVCSPKYLERSGTQGLRAGAAARGLELSQWEQLAPEWHSIARFRKIFDVHMAPKKLIV